MGDLLRRCLMKRRDPDAPPERRRGAAVALWGVMALIVLWALFNLRAIGDAFVQFHAFLAYRFIRRALIVGTLVSLCAFLLLRISERSRMRGDSAIALISTSALAAGVIVTSMTSGMNVDVYNYMFGSILAMSASDVYVSLALSAVVLVLFVLCYPRIFAVTFDEAFARATGVRASAFNMLIAFLTALTVVVGMRMMGTLLISSLIIFPALSSMRLFSRFRAVTVCSAVVSVACFTVGMLLSCVYSLPTGAGIVAVNLFVFILFSAIAAARS